METEDISASSFGNDDGGISPNAIIGSEDRVQITNTNAAPYQYTCYMYSVYKDGTKSGVYSGFMIGAKAAVTAAHCVFDGKSTLDHVVVIPGKNDGTEPYGSARSTKVAIMDEYVNNGNRADDWAIIELNWNIGYQSKWPALKYKSGSYNGTSVENTGYPGKSEWFTPQNKESTLMFSGKGTIRYSYEYNDRFIYGRGILRGDWDATGGNSGGPVFAYYPETGYTVIGILTGGSTVFGEPYGDNTCYTTATRISSDMYEIFMSYC
ncbi:MAG: trypsin-like serine protease [Oscillospiraceae bacterium]|nr:trypsin-like serine protease [Oscillospiraceae bacterium]